VIFNFCGEVCKQCICGLLFGSVFKGDNPRSANSHNPSDGCFFESNVPQSPPFFTNQE